MSKTIHTLFQLAAKFFYQKYRQEGGSLDELANKVGITPTYLSAVINGSRVSSLDLQNRISKIFYGPYDKFIAVGRRISEGKDPLGPEMDIQTDSVEKILAQLTHLVIDHKRVTEELKKNELRFRDISHTSGDMIFELDKYLRITFISGKIWDTTGLEEKDLLGKNISAIYSEHEWNRLEPLIYNSIKKHKILDTVITVKKNGNIFYRHCIAKPIFEAPDNTFSGFRGTYRDITRKKRLEHNLTDEMTLFQAAIDSVEEHAIVITDKKNKVVKWNGAYQKMMGFPREIRDKQKITHNFAFLKSQLKDPEDYRKGIIKEFSSNEETIHYFEMKNGRTIKRMAAPIYRDGNFTGRVTFLSDVTDISDVTDNCKKVSGGKG